MRSKELQEVLRLFVVKVRSHLDALREELDQIIKLMDELAETLMPPWIRPGWDRVEPLEYKGHVVGYLCLKGSEGAVYPTSDIKADTAPIRWLEDKLAKMAEADKTKGLEAPLQFEIRTDDDGLLRDIKLTGHITPLSDDDKRLEHLKSVLSWALDRATRPLKRNGEVRA